MKFTVHVSGADNGLVEKLVAAANRKLAPKLRRLAVHAAHHAHNAPTHHVSAIAHPKAGGHAASHHAATTHATTRRSASHPAVTANQLANVSPGHTAAAGFPGSTDPQAASIDSPVLDTLPVANAPSPSPDGAALFDVTIDATASEVSS